MIRVKTRLLSLILVSISISTTAIGQSKEEKIPYANPQKQTKPAAQTTIDQPPAETAIGALKDKKKLPKVELSKDILFKLLSTNIATQRGEWQSAYATVLKLAQQTRDPRLAKQATEIATSAQQIPESLAAIALWRELAQDDAEVTEANRYYLSMMVVTNSISEIEKFFEAQLQNHKDQPATKQAVIMHQAQQVLARVKDTQLAFATLENLLKPYPASLDSHIVLARAAHKNGDAVRSALEARSALSIAPDSELAIVTLAQALGRAQGLKEIAQFLETKPDALEVRIAYASMLVDEQQLALAEAEFMKVLAQQKRDDLSTTRCTYTLGVLNLSQGKLDQAQAYFLSYIDLVATTKEDEDPTLAYVNLAQISLQRKDPVAADLWLSKVDSRDGENPRWFDLQMRRAMLLANSGKYREARQFLQGIQPKKDSEEVQLLQTEAQVMKDAGQIVEALVLLEAALGNFSRSPELLYDYAMLAESLQRYADMELALKELIRVSPDNPFAYNALGYSYADRNLHLNEALVLIEKANQLRPNDPYILDSLGWVHFRLNNLSEAEQILRRSYTMRQDPDITVHLAEILWVQNKRGEAQTLFNSAAKKDAASELLKTTLQRLGATLSGASND
ncbi:MAG: hypothetical protein Q8Q55_01440 [Undibacterium sp.]|nr:hypothetical protein [Undibacterium sp.]